MNALPAFPAAVHDYIRSVFADVNRRICEKIARVPNTSEPSLDMTFIECLSHSALLPNDKSSAFEGKNIVH